MIRRPSANPKTSPRHRRAPASRGRFRLGGRVRVAAIALAIASCGLCLFAPLASADDLLILNGDTEVLAGGSYNYSFVVIDGTLRLEGDTTINASSIYFGPDASLSTCYVAGTGGGDGRCTAGRSLTLNSGGPLTVAGTIDLTGGTGAVQPGGSLSLSGSPVIVAGDVYTAGSGGGTSGSVSINSGSQLSVGQIDARGAPVSLHATDSIDVSGDIDTYGDPAVASPSAGPVTATSTSGAVRIAGAVNAYGMRTSSPSTEGGGNGAPVTISGTDVRVGGIETAGGSSDESTAGQSAPIKVTAVGSATSPGTLSVLGPIDASGQSSGVFAAAGGQSITLTAAGPLTAGDEIDSRGSTGAGGSSAGGAITLSGSSVNAGTINVSGGDAPSSGTTVAGAGGSISVTGPSGAALSDLYAGGGNAYSGGSPGSGGSINVTSSGGSVTANTAQTPAGYTNSGTGNNGGPITISADTDLTVGDVSSDGSGAGGSGNPATHGGNAGNLTLRAATGTLSMEGNVSAIGGDGQYDPASGQLGGLGGAGGQIELVAHAVGPLASLSSRGGDGGGYGNDQGPGGPGGAIFAWTNATLFNEGIYVTSDGGDGNPTGTAGAQNQESSPTGLGVSPTTHLVSFTSQSPNADHYLIMAAAAGQTPKQVLETASTSGLRPKVPVCVPVTLTVVAVSVSEQWLSDPSSGIAYKRSPSAHQTCSQAPALSAPHIERASLARLRHHRWNVALRLRVEGIGSARAVLGSGRKRAGTTGDVTISRAGRVTLHLVLPDIDRKPGIYHVHVTVLSPDGHGRVTDILRLELAA